MGADPRQRFHELDETVRRLERQNAALDLRVKELERLIAAISRGNAGKDLRRG